MSDLGDKLSLVSIKTHLSAKSSTNAENAQTTQPISISNSITPSSLHNSYKNSPDLTQEKNFFSSLNILTHAAATPISNILVNLELIERQICNEKYQDQKPYIHRALISARYLKKLMHNATANSTISQSFIIKDALKELIEICKNPNQEGLLVPFIQLDDSQQLTGNRLFFQEAVLCLINNAFQAYKNYAPNKLVVLMADCSEHMLNIKIADGAKGFLVLNDNHASTPIKKIPNSSTGTGLTVVKEVIENHFKGEVLINSRLNKGTTISCNIPLK